MNDPARAYAFSGRDYEGQTALGKWVADKLRERGQYAALEELVEIAILEESPETRSSS